MSDALFVYTDYHPEHTFTLKKRVLIRLIGKGRGVGGSKELFINVLINMTDYTPTPEKKQKKHHLTGK